MKQPPTKVFNLDLLYPTDLVVGTALIWLGCHYYAASLLALLPFGIGIIIVLAAVLTPNIQAFVDWRREARESQLPDPDPIRVGDESE